MLKRICRNRLFWPLSLGAGLVSLIRLAYVSSHGILIIYQQIIVRYSEKAYIMLI